jgi:hypothetical protein
MNEHHSIRKLPTCWAGGQRLNHAPGGWISLWKASMAEPLPYDLENVRVGRKRGRQASPETVVVSELDRDRKEKIGHGHGGIRGQGALRERGKRVDRFVRHDAQEALNRDRPIAEVFCFAKPEVDGTTSLARRRSLVQDQRPEHEKVIVGPWVRRPFQ